MAHKLGGHLPDPHDDDSLRAYWDFAALKPHLAAAPGDADLRPYSSPRHNQGQTGSAFRQPCEAFCQHLRTLGGKEGEPLKSGTSCETFCIDTQEAGHDLKIACVLKIQSCGEMQSCNR